MRSDLTAVVVHHSGLEALGRCLASLAAADCPVVLVDVSPDGEARGPAHDAEMCTYLAAPENLGYGWACNRGVAAAATPAVLISNSDVTFTAGAVDALAVVALKRRAVVAPVQVDPVAGTATQDNLLPEPGSVEALTRWLGFRRGATLSERRLAVTAVAGSGTPHTVHGYVLSGACLAFGMLTYAELGGFDPDFFLYEEDIDLCLRARASKVDLVLVPAARVLHSSGTNARGPRFAAVQTARASQLLLWRKHGLPVRVLKAVQLAGLALRTVAATVQRDDAAAGVWRQALLSRPRATS